MTDGDIYKREEGKGWVLDVDKVNKVLFDFKAIRQELICENEDYGKIDCDNCPFYNIHHCNIFRTNIDAIRPMQQMSTLERLNYAENKLRRVERLLQPFSHHAGDEGYGMILDKTMMKKLQEIFSEKNYMK